MPLSRCAKFFSACPAGIEAHLVTVETFLRHQGIPSFVLVGLPDASVRESKERVMAAIRNTGFQFPSAKITVNLAPADIKKVGAELDLPLAVGILAQEGRIPAERAATISERYLFVGELGLDGLLRCVRGALAMASVAQSQGFQGVVVPEGNKGEVSLVKGLEVIACRSLSEVVDWISGHLEIRPFQWKEAPISRDISRETKEGGFVDLAEIHGNTLAKRALEVAAAGGHNMLMVGPPGVGKTLLAKALAGILPPLNSEEMVELTRIYSSSGSLGDKTPIVSWRPFRAVHHTASDVALIGGGAAALPGEVTLAHRGVLFLDELGEFPLTALDALRQPLEDGEVLISRAAAKFRYPARFMLVAATNPCPCGWWGSKERECLCTPYQILRYRRKLSGPLLDRIDIHVEVTSGEFREVLLGKTKNGFTEEEKSDQVRSRVVAGRRHQANRFHASGKLNAHMNLKEIKAYCKIGESAQHFLGEVMRQYGLSVRAYHRILKVARTIADLVKASDIQTEHLSLAVKMRALDRMRSY